MKLFRELQNILWVTGETAVKLSAKWFKKKNIKQTENNKVISDTNKIEGVESKEVSEPVVKVNIEDFPQEDGLLLMVFCPHCGIGNPPDSQSCISCGKAL